MSTAPAPLERAAAPVGAATTPLPGPGRALQVALVLGAFVGMADATLVAVALDPIARHFAVPLSAAQAVLGVYLVTVTATLPLTGRLADRVGRRRAYLAGFAVFAAGSVLAALAPSFGVVIAGRVVQAAGGGMLTSGSLALIAQHAPRGRTGRSVALMVVAQAVAGLVAPPIGGGLVALAGWRAVFWVGVPLGALGAAMTLALVPAGEERRDRPGLDLGGAVGLAALLLGAGVGIGGLGGTAVAGWPAWAWLLVAAGGVAVLVVAERRAAHPLLDPRLLRRRFVLAATASLLSTGALMSCFAFLPFWLQDAHGASAALAGAAFLPVGVGIAAAARSGGRLGDLGRTRRATGLGMAIAAAGLAVAAVAAATRLWPLLVVGLLVLGLGNGVFSSPNTAAAMTVAPRSALGGAAAFLSTARNAGVVAGLGITGAAYTGAVRGAHADAGAAALFAGAAVVCLAVAALTRRAYAAPR